MLKDAIHALRSAQRPVLIFGAGIRLADAADEARELARLIGAPAAPTWGGRDVFPADDPTVLCVGGFGTHGTRAANFAVQNADWILSVGSRLDSKATGTPRRYFARAAQVFMVDIDLAEVRKFGGELGRTFTGVQADAKKFLADMIAEIELGDSLPDFGPWRLTCGDWMRRYPVCPPEYDDEAGINPYVLVRDLSELCEEGEVIVSDTGLGLGWMMQGFDFREGQRYVHAFNQTPMGYGLPAAIGAAYARPGRRVILVTGDGGLMLNIQELAVVAHHRLPIKIVLLNNGGHAMCRQTQDQWLGGKYYSTSTSAGLCMPYFYSVASGFGIPSHLVLSPGELREQLAADLANSGPTFLDAQISGRHRLIPQVPYGTPNEDGSPRLPREELEREMIVELVA